MATPVIAARATSSRAAANPVSISLPTGIVAGNILWLVLQFDAAITTLATPTGWTAISVAVATGSAVFAKVADGTEGASVSVSYTVASNKPCSAVCFRITGAGGFVFAKTNPAATATFDPPNVAPAVGATTALWLAMAQATQLSTVSVAPTGFTVENDQNSPTPLASIHIQSLAATLASKDPAAFTLSAASSGICSTVCFLPIDDTPVRVIAQTNGNSATTTSTTQNVVLPTGIASSDVVVAAVHMKTAQTLTWPAGWTKIITDNIDNTNGLSVAWKPMTGIEGGTTIACTSSGTDFGEYIAWLITNSDRAQQPATSINTNALGSGLDALTVTPSWGADDDLGIVLLTHNLVAMTVTGWPTGYTNGQLDFAHTTQTADGMSCANRQFTGSSENPNAFTTSASSVNKVVLIVVKPVIERSVASGAMGRISGSMAIVDANVAVVAGAMGHVAGAGVLTDGEYVIVSGALGHVSGLGAVVVKNGVLISAALNRVSGASAIVVNDTAIIAGAMGNVSGLSAIVVKDAAVIAGAMGHVSGLGAVVVNDTAVIAGALGKVAGLGEIVVTISDDATISGALGHVSGSAAIAITNYATIAGALGTISGASAVEIDDTAAIAGALGRIAGAGVVQLGDVLTLNGALGRVAGSAVVAMPERAVIAGSMGAFGGSGAIAEGNVLLAAGALGGLGGAADIALLEAAVIAGSLGVIEGSAAIGVGTALTGIGALGRVSGAGQATIGLYGVLSGRLGGFGGAARVEITTEAAIVGHLRSFGGMGHIRNSDIPFPTDPLAVIVVSGYDRLIVRPAINRVIVVPATDRTIQISAEDRTIAIAAIDRIITVPATSTSEGV